MMKVLRVAHCYTAEQVDAAFNKPGWFDAHSTSAVGFDIEACACEHVSCVCVCVCMSRTARFVKVDDVEMATGLTTCPLS